MLDTKCPCLGIFGHELAASDREYIEARVANAEIVEWPGQGHMVHLVDPDRFAERLASFIDYCSAA
jgi:pimeloyl-ACP methyl ester carboxylesterase